MSENTFKVSIKGPGMDVEKDVSEDKALQVLSVAFSASPQAPDAHVPRTEPEKSTPTDTKRDVQPKQSALAIGEFMSELKIDNNPERIAAIALYLKEQLDQQFITRDELPGWFQKAGEAAPKNITRDVAAAVKQRVIAEDHNNSGQYYVTGTGEKKLKSQEKS